MRTQLILPTALIVIDVTSAIVYGWQGDYRRMVYWVAAAVLTASVTY